jgi:hypothetical protein
MRKHIAIALVLSVIAMLWVATSANEPQRVPGPGSGVVRVEGTVEIGNAPMVNATQNGPWKMSLTNVPDVRVVNTAAVSLAPLDFIKTGKRYAITWPGGERDVIAVTQVTTGGWVRVQGAGQQRWMNVSLARAVEEIS